MDAERWARIETMCVAARKLALADRADFLNQHCAGDAALRTEVEGLLASLDAGTSFLDAPPTELGAQLLKSLAEVALPGQIGPYRIVRRLGGGGMGEVFLAQEERDGLRHPVALKLVRPGLDSREVLRRFRQERQILAGLKHPNIARLFAGGATEGGRPYFVMEYADGVPIDDFCHRDRLSVNERLRLMQVVCRALHHAHQNLVVHRDLKPNNILVTAEGRPVVLDFGIGKVLDPATSVAESTLTRSGPQPLTPEYAAPEQLRGEAVTTAADVYGLGVLLYELLTGERPHRQSGRTLPEFEQALSRTDPTAPSTLLRRARQSSSAAESDSGYRGVRAVDADIDTIVLKALRAEPSERYASALELADDVDRYLTGHPVRARPPAVAYRVGKFVRRHLVGVAAAAAVAGALIGTTAYTVEQTQRVAVERDRALEVQGFLLETFGAAGPDQEVGDPVTARALLDGQARVLSAGFSGEPALEASMMGVLAEGYDRLGLFEEAESWAREALELRERVHGAEDIDIAVARNVFGWIRYERGASDEAEGLLRSAVETARRAPRGGDRALSRALNDLGVILETRGEFDEAAQLYVEALAIRRDLFGPDHRSVGVTMSNLSVIYHKQGLYEEAIRLANESLDIFRASLGADHRRSIQVAQNIATFRYTMGDWEEAERQYRDLLQRQSARYGEAHPAVIVIMASLTSVLQSQRKWSEAAALAEQTKELQERTLGPDHPDVARTLVALGRIASIQGDSTEAFRMADRALALQRRAFGNESEVVAETLSHVAEMHRRLGALDRAAHLTREAHGILEQVFGPDHPRTAAQLGHVGTALSRLQRYDEALALTSQAHTSLRQAFADDHPQVQNSRLGLAYIHIRLGSRDLADSLLTVADRELRTAADSAIFSRTLERIRARLEAN